MLVSNLIIVKNVWTRDTALLILREYGYLDSNTDSIIIFVTNIPL